MSEILTYRVLFDTKFSHMEGEVSEYTAPASTPEVKRQVWETPRVVSSPFSDTAGGPTRGLETGGDIGPS